MRIYFLSNIYAALKIGGIYIGLIDNSQQFLDINLNDDIFCEIIPTNSKKMPIRFILNKSFLESPPDCVQVFNLISCYKILATTFLGTGGGLKVAFQKKLGSFDSLVTLFTESQTKLFIENQNGFEYLDMPDGFELLNCFYKEYMGEHLIIIEGKTDNKTLIIIDEKTPKILFQGNYHLYQFDYELKITIKFSDIAKHLAISTWVLLNGEFTLQNYAVESQIDLLQINPKFLNVAFFEEVLCGGDFKVFLSDQLKARSEDLKEYLGQFIDVILPPFNIDKGYVGLIYKDGKNKFYTKYFKAEFKNNKITNILPYQT